MHSEIDAQSLFQLIARGIFRSIKINFFGLFDMTRITAIILLLLSASPLLANEARKTLRKAHRAAKLNHAKAGGYHKLRAAYRVSSYAGRQLITTIMTRMTAMGYRPHQIRGIILQMRGPIDLAARRYLQSANRNFPEFMRQVNSTIETLLRQFPPL